MKKKEILIILATILLIAVTILIIFYSRVKKIEYNPSILGGTYQPEFMNEEEKASFDLPTDSKIQVLKRNDEGMKEKLVFIK